MEPPERTHQTLLRVLRGPRAGPGLSSYLLLAGELHLPLRDLTAEVVHLAPQLHDLIVGAGSLVKLFGQVEVLVVEFGVVLGQLVQLLLQVSDDLWGGWDEEGGGVIDQKRGYCQQGNASGTSDVESCSDTVSCGMTTGTNMQLSDLRSNPSSPASTHIGGVGGRRRLSL